MDVTNFYTNQLKPLIGGKIKSILKTSDGFFGLLIVMPNGKEKDIYFLSDDEGNDPGSFIIK